MTNVRVYTGAVLVTAVDMKINLNTIKNNPLLKKAHDLQNIIGILHKICCRCQTVP